MTKEEWEEYNELYDSDWRVRIAAGIEIGIWKDELPRLKEVLHIEPDDTVVAVLVKNTEKNELCWFDLDGNLDGTETVAVPKSWLKDKENDSLAERH